MPELIVPRSHLVQRPLADPLPSRAVPPPPRTPSEDSVAALMHQYTLMAEVQRHQQGTLFELTQRVSVLSSQLEAYAFNHTWTGRRLRLLSTLSAWWQGVRRLLKGQARARLQS